VDLAATGKILFDNCEIQGITNALYDVSIIQGGLVEVFNSKIRAAQYGIYTFSSHWHIFSSDIRAVDDGGTSGVVFSPAALYNHGADTVVWGSHLHAESSQANQSYEVNAVRPTVGTVTIFGSTVHVKMTTTSIGAANRPMSSAHVFGGTGNFIGTDVTGAKPLANANRGIEIQQGIGNTIGGTTAAARNILSGNTLDGIGTAIFPPPYPPIRNPSAQ